MYLKIRWSMWSHIHKTKKKKQPFHLKNFISRNTHTYIHLHNVNDIRSQIGLEFIVFSFDCIWTKQMELVSLHYFSVKSKSSNCSIEYTVLNPILSIVIEAIHFIGVYFLFFFRFVVLDTNNIPAWLSWLPIWSFWLEFDRFGIGFCFVFVLFSIKSIWPFINVVCMS